MPGDEARVLNVCQCSWSSSLGSYVVGFIVPTLSHYSGIVATAVGNKVSKQLEVG